jgi:hypothetical protein
LAGDQARHDAIPALDGFRALAIIFVMLSHVGLERLFPGQFGVTLFFFLSGYLITTLLRRELERTGRIDLGGFYLRRAVRILPPLYITILFVLSLNAAGAIPPMKLWAVPFDLVFLSNYFPFSSIPIGLWSLAVEEHFYLGFPLLFLLLGRRLSFAQCALAFLGLCAVVLAVRLGEAQRVTDLQQVNFWTHTRLDSILFGSVLALWNNPVADRDDRLPRGVAGYLIAAALLLPTLRHPGRDVPDDLALHAAGAWPDRAVQRRDPRSALRRSAAGQPVHALGRRALLYAVPRPQRADPGAGAGYGPARDPARCDRDRAVVPLCHGDAALGRAADGGLAAPPRARRRSGPVPDRARPRPLVTLAL